MNIPQALEKSLSNDTFGRVATEVLGSKGRYDILFQEEGIIAFVRPHQYPVISVDRALSTITRASRRVEFNRALVLPDRSIRLEAVFEERQPVARGDLVRAGALVHFSHLGIVQPLVQSFVMRLVCTNGAVSNQIVRQFSASGNEGDGIWQWFRKSVREAASALTGIVERFRQMIQEEIDPSDRASVLEALVRGAHLPDQVAEAVRQRALAEPPRNAYDAVNLMTYATSHEMQDPASVVRAQRAVAQFTDATTHHRICPACHRVR